MPAASISHAFRAKVAAANGAIIEKLISLRHGAASFAFFHWRGSSFQARDPHRPRIVRSAGGTDRDLFAARVANDIKPSRLCRARQGRGTGLARAAAEIELDVVA